MLQWCQDWARAEATLPLRRCADEHLHRRSHEGSGAEGISGIGGPAIHSMPVGQVEHPGFPTDRDGEHSSSHGVDIQISGDQTPREGHFRLLSKLMSTEGQGEDKTRPPTNLAFHPDMPTVRLNDSPGDKEPQATPLRLAA